MAVSHVALLANYVSEDSLSMHIVKQKRLKRKPFNHLNIDMMNFCTNVVVMPQITLVLSCCRLRIGQFANENLIRKNPVHKIRECWQNYCNVKIQTHKPII